MNLKRFVRTTTGAIKKYSPEILEAIGIVGIAAGTVMACKATTKIPDILDQRDEELESVHESISDPENLSKEERKNIAMVHGKAMISVAKIYAPALIVESFALSSLVTSNYILKKRNVALLTAYASIKNKFEVYTDRVIERFGEETHKELLYGTRTIKSKEVIVDEDGNKQKIKSTIQVIDKDSELASPYSIVIRKGNPIWMPSIDHLKLQIHGIEDYYTAKLMCSDGNYVFWNDILKHDFSTERTYAGQCCGWFNDNGVDGDTHVQLDVNTVYEIDEEGNIDRSEPVYIVTPNVEGDIREKVWPSFKTE